MRGYASNREYLNISNLFLIFDHAYRLLRYLYVYKLLRATIDVIKNGRFSEPPLFSVDHSGRIFRLNLGQMFGWQSVQQACN